jgi:hypothetical protein
LVETVPLPVRLFEIGASAGLNLRADHFRYNLADGSSFGLSDSPVVFDHAWSGHPLKPVPLRIAERVGSDIAPVNPLTDEGARTLTSYVWPDMPVRLARLRGALEVARQVPADVRREDAVSFVRGLELSSGHVTVVWHSIMWQYLTREDRAAIEERLAQLGAQASESAPLARSGSNRCPGRPERRTSSWSNCRPGRAAYARSSAEPSHTVRGWSGKPSAESPPPRCR